MYTTVFAPIPSKRALCKIRIFRNQLSLTSFIDEYYLYMFMYFTLYK